LRDYLRTVNPGDTIQLRDGLYSGNFIANRVGRSDAPIRLIGSQRSIISNNGGTGFYLTGQYWWLRGFTIRNSRKGIILQSARNNLLERLIIRDTDEEGIILRQGSTDNTIRNCFVTRTGLRVPDYGFGISIGSDQRSSLRGYVDSSNRNSILNNRLQTGSTAEAIHVYEGTCCGFIRDNNFDGRAILYNNNNNNNNNANNNRYNRCWVAINGNSYRIERNNGRYAAVDGFQVIHN
jgi:parallel beta-helix repeat protein